MGGWGEEGGGGGREEGVGRIGVGRGRVMWGGDGKEVKKYECDDYFQFPTSARHDCQDPNHTCLSRIWRLYVTRSKRNCHE